MTEYTRIYDRFEYHEEDLDCSVCLFYERKTKANPRGCENEVCPFEDIRRDVIRNGRIKRRAGRFKCRA
jgi:hypothetical protein